MYYLPKTSGLDDCDYSLILLMPTSIKQSERSVPKVYLIDDDPVATFLLVGLAESVNRGGSAKLDSHPAFLSDISTGF